MDGLQWTCALCTLVNSASLGACAACEAPAGALTVPQRADSDDGSRSGDDSGGDSDSDGDGVDFGYDTAMIDLSEVMHGAGAQDEPHTVVSAQCAAANSTELWHWTPYASSRTVSLRMHLAPLPTAASLRDALGLGQEADVVQCVLTLPSDAAWRLAHPGVAASHELIDTQGAFVTSVTQARPRPPVGDDDAARASRHVVIELSALHAASTATLLLKNVLAHLLAEWEHEVKSHGGDLQPAKRPRCSSAGSSPNLFLYLGSQLFRHLAALDSQCCVCHTKLLYDQPVRLQRCDADMCAFVLEDMDSITILPLLRQNDCAPAALSCAFAYAAATGVRAGAAFEPFPSFLLAEKQLRPRAGFFDSGDTRVANDVTHSRVMLQPYEQAAASDSLANIAANKRDGLLCIAAILKALPPIAELAACDSEGALRVALRALAWSVPPPAATRWTSTSHPDLAYRVLRFVLTSMRAQLTRLDTPQTPAPPPPPPPPQVASDESTAQPQSVSAAEHFLSSLPGVFAVFALTHATDGHAARFAERKAISATSITGDSEAAGFSDAALTGSYFMFHGSSLQNWFSICRNGLRPLSATPLMANGASFGGGIYTGDLLTTALAYTCRGEDPNNSSKTAHRFLLQALPPSARWATGALVVVAVVEVLSNAKTASNSSHATVLKEADDVTVRYLAVLNSYSSHDAGHKKNVSAAKLNWNAVTTMHQHIDALHAIPPDVIAAREHAEQLLARALEGTTQSGARAALPSSSHSVLGASTASGVSTPAMTAIMRELRTLSTSNPWGMAVSLPDDNDVTRLRVSLTDFASSAPELAADLRAYASATGRPEAIELELRFDGVKFPFTPPFVRVVRPTFAFRTGHVTIGGSICTELLTTKGWSPAYSIENVLTSIRADLVDGGARLNLQRSNAEYSESGARSAFIRVARDHGWET